MGPEPEGNEEAAVLRAAVVGVGYLGKFHAEKISRSQSAELAAVVDTEEKQAREIQKKTKAHHALTDYKQLPELGVQCACVVTTTSTHFDVASWLLANGVDVLVEKPITVTVKEAEELIQIAQHHGRILQVGHLERFNPAFRAMKEVLDRPRFFEVRRIAQFKGRGHDVDVVSDLMIHDIDIVAHLVDRPLVKVEAVGVPVLTETVDIANARLTFEGGAIANVSASRAAFKSERSIRVFQPNTYMSLDYEKKRLKIYTRTGKKTLTGLPDIQISERKIQERDALEHEIEAFLESVKYRSVPEVTGYDGLRALELAERIRQAFHESEMLLDEDFPKEELLGTELNL